MMSLRRAGVVVAIALWVTGTGGPGSVSAQPPVSVPIKRALLVGINEYAARLEVPTLTFAENDIKELEAVLTARGYNVTVMKGPGATRSQIITYLENTAGELKPQDTFVLYLAGHGARSRINSKVYWLANDTTIGFLEATGIRLAHLMDTVADIKAGYKIVLLDHCFSGEVISDLNGAAPVPPMAAVAPALPVATAAVPSGAPRGSGTGPHFSRNVEAVDVTFNDQWTAPGGVMILAASRGDAYESADLKHGVFTYSVLKALNSRAADYNKDGKLTADEFRLFVKDDVKDVSEKVIHRPQAVMDRNNGTFGWYVAADLPISTPDQAESDRSRLRLLLSSWFNKQYLTYEQRALCWKLLDDEVEAIRNNTQLPPQAVQILKAIRMAASQIDVPERQRAEMLVTDLRDLGGDQ